MFYKMFYFFYEDVPSAVNLKPVHALCLAHIVNLSAEVFHRHTDFIHTSNLIAMIKSSPFKNPGRKIGFWST